MQHFDVVLHGTALHRFGGFFEQQVGIVFSDERAQ